MQYNYSKICSDLLKGLPQRTTKVIERRFGLKNGKETLERIGQDMGITRERVRQIENEGISRIKEKAQSYKNLFRYFNETLEKFGGLKKEESLLDYLGNDKDKGKISLFLSLSEDIRRVPEGKDFYPCWAKRRDGFDKARKTVKLVSGQLKKEKRTLSLDEIYEYNKESGVSSSKQALESYLEACKEIGRNHKGKFGLKNWLEINPKGVKDKAYLVLKEKKQPLHFTKVAEYIEKLPLSLKPRPAHTATVHNELIKDSRFVLVGRGMYALREWGYEPGVIKDIIYKVLEKSNRPLSREEILKRVSEQRIVKENTVFLNLQDKSLFAKDSKGRYLIQES
jgi:transcriptional regulator with XRE-family HTH domain